MLLTISGVLCAVHTSPSLQSSWGNVGNIRMFEREWGSRRKGGDMGSSWERVSDMRWGEKKTHRRKQIQANRKSKYTGTRFLFIFWFLGPCGVTPPPHQIHPPSRIPNLWDSGPGTRGLVFWFCFFFSCNFYLASSHNHMTSSCDITIWNHHMKLSASCVKHR